MASIDVPGILNDVTLALAAYEKLKGIWTAQNPGKTEDDFRADLRNSSNVNIVDASAQLIADGWVLSPDGRTWTKP
jgi:hypothetical protein